MERLVAISYKSNEFQPNGDYSVGINRAVGTTFSETKDCISIKLANGQILKIPKRKIVLVEDLSCFKL